MNEKKRDYFIDQYYDAYESDDIEELVSLQQKDYIRKMIVGVKAAEYLNAEKPENEYGVKALFAADFVKPDMEDTFMAVSADFLTKEKRIDYGRKNGMFLDLPFPFDMDSSTRDYYIQTILLIMLACVEDGSSYAADVLKELYKTYYKQEYSILKRINSLDIMTYDNYFEPDDYNNNGETDNDTDILAARVTIMCELFNIKIDDPWNAVLELLNERAERDRFLWRSYQVLSVEDKIIESKTNKRKEYSDWIAEKYPEMVSVDVYGSDKRYKIIDELDRMTRLVMEELNIHTSINDGTPFDLFNNMVGGLEGLNIKLSDLDNDSVGKWNHRELLLIAYINYLSTLIGKLYKEREKELQTILGVSRLELVNDDELIDDNITMEMIERLTKREDKDVTDFRKDKIMSRLKSIKVSDIKKYEQNDNVSETQSKTDLKNDNTREIDLIKKELKESRSRVREEAEKAKNQRLLYEETRERTKSLKKLIEKQTEEHAELVALRELVYSLDKGDIETEYGISTDEMILKLNEKRCAIIGGHENWSNKMKKAFPGWVVIPVGESLNLDRALGGIDAAFIYTDVLEHAMYYKMMNAIRSNKTPFHYIHGVNIDIVVKAMYQALE